MASPSTWFLWALLSAVFASLTAIFTKLGIQGVNSDLAAQIRTAIILLVLGLSAWLTGKWSNPFQLPAKTWIFLELSSLSTGASWASYFRSLQLGEASRITPVDKPSLVLVAIFAFGFLGKRPDWNEWLGILMVAWGVIVLALKPWPGRHLSGLFPHQAQISPICRLMV